MHLQNLRICITATLSFRTISLLTHLDIYFPRSLYSCVQPLACMLDLLTLVIDARTSQPYIFRTRGIPHIARRRGTVYMSITNRKKRAASSHATPISSQETSAGEGVPLTSIDGDELQLRLSALHQLLYGQSTDVVERLCQEIMDASQGQVQLVLQRYRYLPSHMPSFPEHSALSLPVVHAGRTYGRLEIGPDPTRPDQPVLAYQKMQVLAIHCAFILYSLETAAYFQREYPSPVHLAVSLTPREQEVLELICRGHQRKHIASMLHIKPATVGKICEKMYPRLGVRTEREAIAAAFRLGLSFPIEHLSATIDPPSMKQEA